MKMAKAIRKQAQTAERVAAATADAFVANQMRSLARAFRSQAEILRKKEKTKKKWSWLDSLGPPPGSAQG